MTRNLTLLSALGAGLVLAPGALAQAPAAPATAPAATTAPVTAPQPVPAKIALINFEQVVLASNEGQTVTANTQKKFEPRRTQIEALAADVDASKKKLAALPTTAGDEERSTLLRQTDSKEKQLNRDAEDAQTAYNTEWQEGLGKVAQKIAVVMKNYVQQAGYTLLLDVSSQQSNVLWASGSDISQTVVDVYNKQSGVTAPPPTAPRPSRPAGSTTPRTAPKPSGK